MVKRFPLLSDLLTVKGALTMDTVRDDHFVVFLREDRSQSFRPDYAEEPFIACSTYEEARRIQRELQGTSRDSVIRYVGETGGGD